MSDPIAAFRAIHLAELDKTRLATLMIAARGNPSRRPVFRVSPSASATSAAAIGLGVRVAIEHLRSA